ncbi:MAG: LysM peptidoglycan-binding domain-containing protein [Anaerolineaceae bacterium]|nr:LysM peptidoglycan-binding domain-containing protein [Anaerolineaceae bacterium]
MANRRWTIWVSLIGLLLLLGLIVPVLAQENPACPVLVEMALAQVGNNCGGLGRNIACYGYNRVDATFAAGFDPQIFAQPADQTSLADFQTIRTAPLDVALNQWGIAVLNVQANVPDTLPGQAVTMLLFGDSEIENAIEMPANPADRITVITQADVTLFSGPGTTTDPISTTGTGTVLDASARSVDGLWIKVQFSSGSAWLERGAVNDNPRIDALPVADSTGTLSPMQAFYLRNTPGQDLECGQMPSVLAIQSPQGIAVDLTVNGAHIRLGSLVALQIVDNDTLQLTTLEGHAELEPDTSNATSVPAGMTASRCLESPASLGTDQAANDQTVGANCSWEERATTPEEIAEFEVIHSTLEQLGLNQETGGTPVVADECPVGSTIVHTVSRGENLFRIGLRYRTGMGAIMAANGLADPNTIYVGQRLTIPCGVNTGLPAAPPVIPTPVPGVTTPPVAGLCGGFRATSPLDGLSYGTETFYWDSAPGAQAYQVNIYNYDEAGGARVGTFFADAGATNLTADLSIESIGYGFEFGWEVAALVDGQVVCSSGPFRVPRAAAPAPPQQTVNFSASWVCGPSVGELTVDYSNIPSSETSVQIIFTDSMAGPGQGGTYAVPPYSGSKSYTGVFTVSNGKVIAFPSGVTVNLPGSMGC